MYGANCSLRPIVKYPKKLIGADPNLGKMANIYRNYIFFGHLF